MPSNLCPPLLPQQWGACWPSLLPAPLTRPPAALRCAVLQVLYWLMVVGYQLRMLEVRLDMRSQFESDSDDGSSGPFRTSLPPGRW